MGLICSRFSGLAIFVFKLLWGIFVKKNENLCCFNEAWCNVHISKKCKLRHNNTRFTIDFYVNTCKIIVTIFDWLNWIRPRKRTTTLSTSQKFIRFQQQQQQQQQQKQQQQKQQQQQQQQKRAPNDYKNKNWPVLSQTKLFFNFYFWGPKFLLCQCFSWTCDLYAIIRTVVFNFFFKSRILVMEPAIVLIWNNNNSDCFSNHLSFTLIILGVTLSVPQD